jgi:hypothetical protein
MVQNLGGAKELSKDSDVQGRFILPLQVIVRWVRAFSQGRADTNYHLEWVDPASGVAAGTRKSLEMAQDDYARYN